MERDGEVKSEWSSSLKGTGYPGQQVVTRGVRAQKLRALAEGPGLIPNINMAAHNCMQPCSRVFNAFSPFPGPCISMVFADSRGLTHIHIN